MRRRAPPFALSVAALSVLTALPAAASGQSARASRDAADTLGVLGTVVDRDTQNPLEGVAVTMTPLADSTGARPAGPTPATVLTGADGRFVFEQLDNGHYRITMERLGYGALADSVAFDAAFGLRIQAAMVPEALELEPLFAVVEARSRSLEANGFYQRRARGIGWFIARDEIQEGRYQRVSDVLRMVPGVRISTASPRPLAPDGVVLLRGGCVADVYVDGVRTVRPFPVDLMLNPDDLDAVEVYHNAEMSARFGTSTCGAVMIWTHVPNPRPGGSHPFTVKRTLVVLGFIGAVWLIAR